MTRRDDTYLAQKVINKYIDNSDTEYVRTRTVVEGDGYDSFGPESEIYTLYVLYKKNGKYNIDVFGRHDFFEDDNDEYEYEKTLDENNSLKIANKYKLL